MMFHEISEQKFSREFCVYVSIFRDSKNTSPDEINLFRISKKLQSSDRKNPRRICATGFTNKKEGYNKTIKRADRQQ